MAAEILLNPPQLYAEADAIKQRAEESRDTFQSLRSDLNDLADSFRGRAASAFEGKFEEWDQGAQQVVDALEALAEWLRNAGQTIEDTDAQLAEGIS